MNKSPDSLEPIVKQEIDGSSRLHRGGEIHMRYRLLLVAVLASAMTVTAQKKDSAEVMLGAALHQEEVEGNCTDAIKTYQKLIQDKKTPRNVAARAQLHIGTCREKLGQREARAAYQAVINNYADQSDVAGDARSRISALGAKPSSTVSARFLTFHQDPNEVPQSISADGRFHGVMDWRGDKKGDVIVHDLVTGESKTLYRATCTTPLSNGRCKGSTSAAMVSPDGRQVAYALFADEAFELRVTPNETGGKSGLVLSKPGVDIYPLDWTPSGQAVLVLTREVQGGPDRTQQIGLVSVQDGTFKPVKSFKQATTILMGRMSPDGRYAAYSSRKTAEDAQVHVVATDGSAEVELTTTGNNLSPIWSPDGKHLLFVSNRSGTYGLWAAGMKEGRPEGIPISIKRDTGPIRGIGMTRSGSYYYVQDASLAGGDGFNVFEAELDPVTGKQMSQAKLLSESFVGSNTGPSWSPDGKYVAFKRRSPQNNNIRNLVVKSMESGAERIYSAPDWTNQQFGFGPGIPIWFHDGSLFIGSEPIPGQPR
jgi:dipeptidyl aminopeptidase/acylaminoacyl peptidase/uncharacterized protein (UPF0147 family)